MTCKGICVRYKAQKPVGTGRYASGQRRCQICEIFIKWEGLWCPCCGYRLRTKPRNLKYKAKLRARVEADSIEAESNSISAMEQELVAESKAKTTKKTKAKEALEKDFKPISDMRASGLYRMEVAKNLLEKCCTEIKQKKLVGLHA